MEVIKCLKEGKKESSLFDLNFSLNLIELMDTIRKECNLYYDADILK